MAGGAAAGWLDLGPTFIRRVLITTLWLGTIAALCISVYVGWRPALAWGIGVALGMADLALLDGLLNEAIGRRRKRALVILGVLKFGAIYAAGALLLLRAHVAPLPLLAGFPLFLGVALFKVLGRLVLTSTPLSRERDGRGGPYLREAPRANRKEARP